LAGVFLDGLATMRWVPEEKTERGLWSVLNCRRK
jgi:hypothetical protein